MPARAPRICGCGRKVAAGARCECSAVRDRERGTARERGYDAEWEKASKAFLALPGNERCACGCGRSADAVDHDKPHKGDEALFWDRNNWRPVNRRCNSRKAAREERGAWRPKSGSRSEPFTGRGLLA